MSQPMNEDQVLEALGRLSAQGKRKVLQRLLGGMEELDRIVDLNREKLLSVCRERGMDFGSLTEEQREEWLARILHEE